MSLFCYAITMYKQICKAKIKYKVFMIITSILVEIIDSYCPTNYLLVPLIFFGSCLCCVRSHLNSKYMVNVFVKFIYYFLLINFIYEPEQRNKNKYEIITFYILFILWDHHISTYQCTNT